MTQLPNYPDAAAFADELANARRLTVIEEVSGATTWRFRPRLARKRHLLSRLYSEGQFAARASSFSTRLKNLDAVIASTAFMLNLLAARTYRVPMWLDLRDLTWDYARDFGGRSVMKTVGSFLLKKVSLSSFRAATRISTTTNRQREYLIDHGVAATRVEVIPNGVPRRIVDQLGLYSGEPRTDGPVRVVYAGLLGYPQGLEIAVDTMKRLRNKAVELHLYGDGVDLPRFQQRVSDKQLSNVHVHGHVPYYDYLRSIASGLSLPFGDAGAFCDRVLELTRDPGARKQMGERGRTRICTQQILEDINDRWVRRIEEALATTAVRATG